LEINPLHQTRAKTAGSETNEATALQTNKPSFKPRKRSAMIAARTAAGIAEITAARSVRACY
jgi:hypothetical protein